MTDKLIIVESHQRREYTQLLPKLQKSIFVEPQVDSLVWRRLQASSLTENRKARMNNRRPA